MSETKFAFNDAAGVNDANGVNFANLTPQIPQGTGQAGRIGQKVKMKWFKFRMSLILFDANPGTANTNSSVVRILLFQPLIPMPQAPDQNDVLARDNILSPVNTKVVRVIYDKIMWMGVLPIAQETQQGSMRMIKLLRRWPNNVLYRDVNDTQAQEPKDQIWIMRWTSYPQPNEVSLGYSYVSRWSYVDI